MTRTTRALREHEKQMSHTCAVMGFQALQRALQYAASELEAGRPGHALVHINMGLSSAHDTSKLLQELDR